MPSRTARPGPKQSPSRFEILHVLHVRDGPPAGFVELRRRVWKVRVDTPPVLSRIDTHISVWGDAISVVTYGTEDPEIRRRVDDLVRKIRGGWRPATGAAGQSGKLHKKRAVIRQVLRDLIFALTGSPPPVLVGPGVWFTPRRLKNNQNKSIRRVPRFSVWDQLLEAHDPDVAEDYREKCFDEIADVLASNYPPLVARAPARRRKRLRECLGKPAGDRDRELDKASRFAFQNPKSLAVAIVALMFRCSTKTVLRVGEDLLRSPRT